MPTPELLHLSDEQITAVMQLARPLAPHQRTQFLEMLAAKLDGRRELGDGVVYRLCRELQKKFFSPPDFNSDTRDRKYVQKRRARPRRDEGEDDRPHRKVQPRTLGAL